jgi:hypothetical protein
MCLADGADLPLRHLEQFFIVERDNADKLHAVDAVDAKDTPLVACGRLVLAAGGDPSPLHPHCTQTPSTTTTARNRYCTPPHMPSCQRCASFAGGSEEKEFQLRTDKIEDWCLEYGAAPAVWIITARAWCVAALHRLAAGTPPASTPSPK